MAGEENRLTREAILFSLIGLVIGLVISVLIKRGFNFVVLLSSFSMIAGFSLISLFQFYRLSKEKILGKPNPKEYEWGVEINLKRLQINADKSSAMLQFAGLMVAGAFVAMALVINDYGVWVVGHQVFFPMAAVFFVAFLHLAFRWWFLIRSSARYLKFQKEK